MLCGFDAELFLDTSRLAAAAAQVVQLGAAYKDLFVANNKSFYFLTHDNTRKAFEQKLKIDYLGLSDNCFLNIESVKNNFEYNQLIISSDNDYYHLNIFRKLLKENNMQFVDLSKTAFVIEV